MAIIFLFGFIGLVLIFLEFFIPGAVLAVVGTLALLVSLGLFFAQYPMLWGLIYMFALLPIVFVICKLALWQIRRSKEKGHFYHGNDQAGYLASSFDQSLIGKAGVVSTELKPAGHISINGKLYHALSETGFIGKGSTVHIVGGKGSHLIVRGVL